jgi:hypothetical protein
MSATFLFLDRFGLAMKMLISFVRSKRVYTQLNSLANKLVYLAPTRMHALRTFW